MPIFFWAADRASAFLRVGFSVIENSRLPFTIVGGLNAFAAIAPAGGTDTRMGKIPQF
jgi:hypothetical protein